MAFFGVCYSPYHFSTNPPPNNEPTAATVDADMKAIRDRGFTHVRTYGVADGNKWNVDKATKYNLTLGLGVWVFHDSLPNTKAQIDEALRQAQSAAKSYNRTLSFDLVIGNELDRPESGNPPPTLVRDAMTYAQGQLANHPELKARVTTCFTGTVLEHTGAKWAYIVQACDTVVYLTVYPWYGQKYNYDHGGTPFDPGNIDKQMHYSWDHGLKNVVMWARKQVVIAEIGWPSAGYAGTSVPNEKTNYGVTKNWVSVSHQYNNNTIPAFDTYWFEMFDEPWKTNEGAWGRHWGIDDNDRNPKW